MNKKKQSLLLSVGALGVVFGDIGTSPLYALEAAFGISGLPLTPQTIAGIISLIIWSITLVVTIKYVSLMTRADNHGEGGIMALIAKIRATPLRHKWRNRLILLGIVGVSLFYGDSVITPAISVLSAVEGVKLFAIQLSPFIVPLSLIILLGLFILQARGTGAMGRLFGPVMVAWFVVSGLGGLAHIISQPAILIALLPTTALHFAFIHPVGAFIAMGAVVLAITGAEALYADMGHFGRQPIRKAWLWLVFPALTLTYLGQGALISVQPSAISSAYFLLFPAALRLPVTILATCATIIASQAVIAGAFSITRQAIHLDLLPRLTIIHTSRHEPGQVYVPFLNWLIAILVAAIIIGFGSSAHLAAAFGLAISGVLAIDTILFLVIVRVDWRKSRIVTGLLACLLIPLDLIFVSSSSLKIAHGAWLPLALCIVSFLTITTWRKGYSTINKARISAEGTLDEFVTSLRQHPTLQRTPGYAVYLGSKAGNAPLALHDSVNQLHELHEHVVVLSVETLNVPHVALEERALLDDLGSPTDGISHITLRFGYKDSHNIPATLSEIDLPSEEANFDAKQAIYFISHVKPIVKRHAHHMAIWRKYFYALMARNSVRPDDYYKLPLDRTVEMTSLLTL